MLRNVAGNNWIVHKLIDNDHINNHYRRLNGAKSQLRLDVTKSHPAKNVGSQQRLCKSNQDLRCTSIRFEDQLRSLENEIRGQQFSLSDMSAEERMKRKVFDESLDVLNRHPKYFTEPKQLFTPRVVRKIVRPASSSRTPQRQVTSANNYLRPKSAVPPTSLPVQQQRPVKAVYFSASDLQRNVSDDSAFGDGHDTCSDRSSVRSSDEAEAFDFHKWLQEQDEENAYTQLLCEITADLLQRQLCTNGNIKEIITIYIRKSRRRFFTGVNVLMKRLCDDLLVPTDESYDGHYYGSFRHHSADPRRAFRPLLEIEPAENYVVRKDELFPSHSIGQEEAKINERQENNTSSEWKASTPSLRMELNCAGSEVLEEDDDDRLSNHSNQNQPHAVSIKVGINIGKITAEADGYCSDFTNNTENDFEEEFDFD